MKTGELFYVDGIEFKIQAYNDDGTGLHQGIVGNEELIGTYFECFYNEADDDYCLIFNLN